MRDRRRRRVSRLDLFRRQLHLRGAVAGAEFPCCCCRSGRQKSGREPADLSRPGMRLTEFKDHQRELVLLSPAHRHRRHAGACRLRAAVAAFRLPAGSTVRLLPHQGRGQPHFHRAHHAQPRASYSTAAAPCWRATIRPTRWKFHRAKSPTWRRPSTSSAPSSKSARATARASSA